MTIRDMPVQTVDELLSHFEAVGIQIWIDGGWAVDALLGQQSRPHGDLDIVVQIQDVERIRYVLESLGYQDIVDADTKPWNFVMADRAGQEIDVHVIGVDEHGNGVYGPPDLGLSYPADCLTGQGVIGGHPVSCISPEWLVRFHTGYKIDDQDVKDVLELHHRFGVPLPEEYIAFSGKVGDGRNANTSGELVKFTPVSLTDEAKEILGAALYHPTPEKIDALLNSVYAESVTRLFGLVMGKIVAAVVGIRLDSQSVAEILHIAVDEGCRGMGYGRRMIELVVQEEALTGLCAETDRDAVGFYERCGFAIESLGEKYPGVERFLCRRGNR